LFCAQAAAAMRGIEIAIAQTVAARILCSIPSKVTVSENQSGSPLVDRFASLLAMFNNVLSSKLTVYATEMLGELSRKGNTASRKCRSSKARDLIDLSLRLVLIPSLSLTSEQNRNIG
jgi:hypothetical protein